MKVKSKTTGQFISAQSPVERFIEKVEIVEESAGGCWLWRGWTNTNGYGLFHNGMRDVMAHRWAYELYVGPIPEGLQLDHLCRVHNCVNPEHLEAVTCQTNILRGNSPQAINSRKTHCLRGHPFAGKNLYVAPNGWRQCRACKQIRKDRSVEGLREVLR